MMSQTFTVDSYSITCVDGELHVAHFTEEIDPEDRLVEIGDIAQRMSVPRRSGMRARMIELVNDWNRKAMIGPANPDRIWHYVLR